MWYVDAARNLLLKFGIEPKTQTTTATVFISRTIDLNSMANQIQSIQGVKIIKRLEKAWAIYVEAQSSNTLEKISSIPGVIEVKPGYEYGDADNINNYYNMEHPPLGKYLIMLPMILLGDYPDMWRIPSMISGGLLCIVVGLIVREITRSNVYAVLASILTAADPLVRSMAGVAMLDIFLALFTALSVYAMLKGSLTLSGVFLGLAVSTKMSGAFTALPLLLIAIIMRGNSIVKIYRDLIIVPIAVFILINIPIIISFSPQTWYEQSMVGAINWHLKTKTPPGEGPPVSAPWMWLYGENPFYLTVSPDTVARGNIYVYIGSLVLAVFLITLARVFQCISMLAIASFLTWLGYVVLWIAGNHSQYSFYMVQLAPLFTALFITQLWIITENTDIVIAEYKAIYKKISAKI
ncbi:MAG: phospholipid carrier-dependent glycosyltransferase [Sulfolobales archaeon]